MNLINLPSPSGVAWDMNAQMGRCLRGSVLILTTGSDGESGYVARNVKHANSLES